MASGAAGDGPSSGPSGAAATADAYHSLKAALDVFNQPAEPHEDVPGRAALVAAAEAVKAEAAKIGLLCSGAAAPPDQLASLARALQQSCVAFCAAAHAITGAAGPSLRAELLKAAQGLVNPCLVLLKEMPSGKDLKPLVGMVWDGVAAVPKAAVDNKGCLFKSLAGTMAVLKDTLKELEELREQQQEQYGDIGSDDEGSEQQQAAAAADAGAAEGQQEQPQGQGGSSGGSGGGGGGGDDELDSDLGSERMSAAERRLLDGSLQLLAASTDTLRAFGRSLLQGPALRLGAEALDAWESCSWHCRHLRRAAEDLGASMYPPQDIEEVASAAQAVFEVTELMADECPDAEGVGAEALGSLSARLAAAHERMQELLAAAQPQPDSGE